MKNKIPIPFSITKSLLTFTPMILHFGLTLDDKFLPYIGDFSSGIRYLGPHQLVKELEMHLGLSGHTDNVEYLRIEQYRQACIKHSEVAKTPPFYQASFDADQFATASELLSRRDELLVAGWDFLVKEDSPSRLTALAEIEILYRGEEEKKIFKGFSDRFVAIMETLQKRKHPFTKIILNEPKSILPEHYLRLFNEMVGENKVFESQEPIVNGNSDLAKFQKALIQKTKKQKLEQDGSLLILKSKRANEAAVFLAKLLKDNPDYQPALIIPERNRTLDIALVQENLPSLGIPSASLARPSLQILKLVSTFLWKPINPYKILEFVSLSVKPLDDDLANLIAGLMANNPGINGDKWFASVSRFFNELDEKAKTDKDINVKNVRGWYNFWFVRPRYDMDKTVPKGDVIEIFNRLKEWAYKTFDQSGGKNNSLLVLSDQSRRIKELLEELPETQLTNLELERIVRTIYEPSPLVFEETAKGHYPYTPYPSAVIDSVDDMVWWNFTQNEPVHFFSKWYNLERKFLQNSDIQLDTIVRQNKLLLWQRNRPVLHAQSRLLLVIPEMIDGKEVQAHPLFENFQAAFSNHEAISYDLSMEKGKENLEAYFSLSEKEEVSLRQLGRPKPFLTINNLDSLPGREYETYSSLDSLFYFPYQWVFRYKLKLYKSSILSIVPDKTLMGNLSHKLFEKMLKEDISEWNKEAVIKYVNKEIYPLLHKEGAVLLMYGREPERANFINKIKQSAWSLVNHLQQNSWKVQETEKELHGEFGGVPLHGIADLILERMGEKAIVDLKWSGRTYRENLIKSEEDLQLMIYTELLKTGDSEKHSAYFIMSDAKMIARNDKGFKDAEAVMPDSDHKQIQKKIIAKMLETWEWRMKQVDKGLIEVRSTITVNELEEYYEENNSSETMMAILEMRDGDAPFDDYKTLINS